MSAKPALEQLTKLPDDKVIQDSAGQKRICYGCADGDLFVWMDDKTQKAAAFELTWYTSGDDRVEHIVRWNGKHLSTGLVDSSEVDGRTHDLQSPTVQLAVRTDKKIVRQGLQFLLDRSARMPRPLTETIAKLLTE